MKYLKTYERLLHFKDSEVVNHPLLGLTIELEKILKKVKDSDNYKKSNVKKYFNTNGDITLYYKDKPGRNLFVIKILNIKEIYSEYDDDIVMVIRYGSFTNNYNINSELLFIYMVNLFKHYIYDTDKSSFQKHLRFPKTEIDNIFNKLQDVDIFFDSIKYNL